MKKIPLIYSVTKPFSLDAKGEQKPLCNNIITYLKPKMISNGCNTDVMWHTVLSIHQPTYSLPHFLKACC